jgi:tetratricopeptide (TPR) repeat protein
MKARRRRVAPLAAAVLLGWSASAQAVDYAGASRLCLTGHYEDCLAAAQGALGAGDWTPQWQLLVMQALMTVGRYDDAAAAADALTQRFDDDLGVLLAVHDLRRQMGDRRAADLLVKVKKIFGAPGKRWSSAEQLVIAGQAALRLGDEPRSVLEAYFDPAAKKEPRHRATYLAAGNLALDKHDDALAARWFQGGLDKLGPDADLQLGLARAFRHGNSQEMLKALDAALKLNPRLVPALLLRAEQAIDAEDFPAAHRALESARAVDANHPLAWAFEAVLAHLASDARGETRDRDRALARWAANPEVDTLIGRKLAEKYRFTEGAAYQRRALKMEPGYLPAKIELAQDLLRLGKEGEGWTLAEESHARDGYDVVAYNLVTLRGHVEKMATLRSPDFLLRMDPREAAVWGDAVLELLREARATVDAKYGAKSPRPVTVEIFADQGDFAVRTFGMPGGAPYLGVCFGNLITVNSPAGNGGAVSNWKSVLWHEYTHVVTLGLTHNKVPRWLSEGISVFEEGRRDPSWGQAISPRFREMILGGELSPVGRLSGAFLSARDGEHLMFAYFQSALVVELIVQRWGEAALKGVLRELGAGMEINAALAAHTAPLAELEKAFESYARGRAQALGPQADWTRPPDRAPLPAFLKSHPRNVWALREEAQRQMAAQEWAKAKVTLQKLLAVDPDERGGESAQMLLAQTARKLGDTAEERKQLEAVATVSGDAQPAFARLLEIGEEAGEWPAVERNAGRLLATSPMSAAAYRGLAQALESRGASESAATAYGKLLRLDPPDPADVHLHLARLLRKRDPRAARHHVLDALSEAPRFREAHRLLLELHGEGR